MTPTEIKVLATHILPTIVGGTGGAYYASTLKKPKVTDYTDYSLGGAALGFITGNLISQPLFRDYWEEFFKNYETKYSQYSRTWSKARTLNDAFKDLNIDKTSIRTKKEIKDLFNKWVKKNHPDLTTDPLERERREDTFKKLFGEWTKIKDSPWFEKLARKQKKQNKLTYFQRQGVLSKATRRNPDGTYNKMMYNDEYRKANTAANIKSIGTGIRIGMPLGALAITLLAKGNPGVTAIFGGAFIGGYVGATTTLIKNRTKLLKEYAKKEGITVNNLGIVTDITPEAKLKYSI